MEAIRCPPDRRRRSDDPRQGPLPMQAIRRNARTAAAAALAVLLAACQSGLPSLGGADAAAERAERLSRQGDHAGAAEGYESAARGAAPDAVNAYWLAAAREWLLGSRVDAAEA